MSKILNKTILRSIRAKLLGLTLSLVLLVAFSTIATFLTLRAHDSDEAVINLVGRQRTLTQQMTWLALSQPQNSNLASLILQFERNLDSLKDGGTAVNAAGDTVVLSSSTDALIRSQLHAVAQTWATFRGHVERLAALPPDDPDYSAAVRALQVDSLVIVDELDAAVDTLEAQTHTKHLRLKNIQSLFLVVALLILGWGYFITRRHIVHPLLALAAAARSIGEGRLSQPIPTLADDELGQLSRSMEAMRTEITTAQREMESRVAERTRQLTVAFEFSQDIIQLLELDQLFDSITERARSLMQAEAASLCLVTSDGKGVTLVARSGLKTKGDNPWQPIRNVPTLQVRGESQTILSDVESSSCSFLDASPHNQCLAAPLRIGDHNIGAICVLRGDRSRFGEEEKRSLMSLANSAAIAIANARLLESERSYAKRTAVLAERERLAATLHDNLAQTLSFLNLKTEQVAQMVGDGQSTVAAAELESIKSAINEAYGQVRAALKGLSEPPHTGEDFVRKLSAYVAEYQETTGLNVDLTVAPSSVQTLTPLTQKQALHIVREALTNVRRHAQAQCVQVHIARINGEVQLRIEDNGNGFDPHLVDSDHHLGLSIMQTRAQGSGGQLTIDSAPGAGTTVVARFPLNPSNQDDSGETL